jgi:uncharacterized cupredoxin-like copper-binding protein
MKRLSTVVLVVALAAGACGGDDAPEASTNLSVQMTDFAFEPDSVAVPAGQEITIELTNAGSVEHDYVILKRGQRIEAETDLPDDEETIVAEFVEFEQRVQPGESTTVTFTAPEAGSYQIICRVPGHFTAGMEGRLRSVSG